MRLAWFLPLGAFVVGVNYMGDPAQMFRGQEFERRMAAVLLGGRNVAGVTDHDERTLQRLIITGSTAANDVVVLGSSRVGQISGRPFPGRAFHNFFVSGATIEDDAAIYEMCRESGRRPNVVILGLDPWILNANSNQPRWVTLAAEYRRAAKRMGMTYRRVVAPLTWSKCKEVLSPTYFQHSVQSLLRHLRHPIEPAMSEFCATDATEGDTSIFLTDGRWSYPKTTLSSTEEQVRAVAIQYALRKPVYSLGKFRKLDSVLTANLEKFLASMKSDGVQVIVFLPPYHPETYRRLVGHPDYSIICDAELRFRNLAAREGIPVVGSFNPTVASCGDGDFYDGMHPKGAAMEMILLSSGVIPVAKPPPPFARCAPKVPQTAWPRISHPNFPDATSGRPRPGAVLLGSKQYSAAAGLAKN